MKNNKLMNKLYLPQKQNHKQQAYERIIAQIMGKIKLNFPKEIKDKEQFLNEVISKCEEKGFTKKFQCKWGWVKRPIEFLESMKEEEWEIEGVKEFYRFYKSKKGIRSKKVKERYKALKLPSRKKVWEIGKEIERELNEYGKKWEIESYLIEIVYWASSGYEIKIGIGPFRSGLDGKGVRKN